MRLRNELGADREQGVSVGFTGDGMIYVHVEGGLYAETSITELAHSVTG